MARRCLIGAHEVNRLLRAAPKELSGQLWLEHSHAALRTSSQARSKVTVSPEIQPSTATLTAAASTGVADLYVYSDPVVSRLRTYSRDGLRSMIASLLVEQHLLTRVHDSADQDLKCERIR